MTDPRREPDILPPQSAQSSAPEPEPGDPPSQGPSLVVLYSILGLVLLVSMFIAALIIRPFALRR
ncbi:MAG TPA: hypothetical protein VFU55_01840 [Terracidiphilus sp.]|nr:hypothetical protein [Terracidiphilus sp.]